MTLTWKRAVRTRLGSRQWRTRRGCYLVHASEHCWGVDLRPIIYSAWHDAGHRWRKLHRLVSLAAAAAALHFIMLVKVWSPEPLIYAALVAALLLLRLVDRPRRRIAARDAR